MTAFPGSSTLIPGLKTKKKYQGFKDEPEWLRYNLKHDANAYGTVTKKKSVTKALEDDW